MTIERVQPNGGDGLADSFKAREAIESKASRLSDADRETLDNDSVSQEPTPHASTDFMDRLLAALTDAKQVHGLRSSIGYMDSYVQAADEEIDSIAQLAIAALDAPGLAATQGRYTQGSRHDQRQGLAVQVRRQRRG